MSRSSTELIPATCRLRPSSASVIAITLNNNRYPVLEAVHVTKGDASKPRPRLTHTVIYNGVEGSGKSLEEALCSLGNALTKINEETITVQNAHERKPCKEQARHRPKPAESPQAQSGC